jgi:hypothetical protein
MAKARERTMSSYTVEDLVRRGTRYAFELVLQHIDDGDEPFVTYGTVAKLLEERLRIPRIFPIHIGRVAGDLMDQIESIENDAPPINALIARSNGIPGKGFGGYYNRLWRGYGEPYWENLSHNRRLDVIGDVRAAVRRYPKWIAVYRNLYNTDPATTPRAKRFAEKDGKPPETARPKGESIEHRKLKKWAAENPKALGLPNTMEGTIELGVLSGDRIDVVFSDGKDFVAVEVKSVHSGEDDWQRGIYQCVKYRAVLEAQQKPVVSAVRAILLTEEPVSADLKERARDLGITLKVHCVNNRQ